ncbi:hypothetical protein [Bathymodiolus thermophilus thioautotrophic gill symbiont]
MESVLAVLKRGYNGTFHYIITKYLNRYEMSLYLG